MINTIRQNKYCGDVHNMLSLNKTVLSGGCLCVTTSRCICICSTPLPMLLSSCRTPLQMPLSAPLFQPSQRRSKGVRIFLSAMSKKQTPLAVAGKGIKPATKDVILRHLCRRISRFDEMDVYRHPPHQSPSVTASPQGEAGTILRYAQNDILLCFIKLLFFELS